MGKAPEVIEYTVKVYSNGTKFWYVNGKLHREGGPAIEWSYGTKEWYLNGKLHREDGPAVEYPDGTKFWCLKGVRYTEEDVKRKMAPIKELTVAEISTMLGYEVKIVK